MEQTVIKMILTKRRGTYFLHTDPEHVQVCKANYKEVIRSEIDWIKTWLPSNVTLHISEKYD